MTTVRSSRFLSLAALAATATFALSACAGSAGGGGGGRECGQGQESSVSNSGHGVPPRRGTLAWRAARRWCRVRGAVVDAGPTTV